MWIFIILISVLIWILYNVCMFLICAINYFMTIFCIVKITIVCFILIVVTSSSSMIPSMMSRSKIVPIFFLIGWIKIVVFSLVKISMSYFSKGFLTFTSEILSSTIVEIFTTSTFFCFVGFSYVVEIHLTLQDSSLTFSVFSNILLTEF